MIVSAVCSLDYSDIVCDGVYDPRGAYPELQSPSARSIFPGLNELKTIPFWQGDLREVRQQLRLHRKYRGNRAPGQLMCSCCLFHVECE